MTTANVRLLTQSIMVAGALALTVWLPACSSDEGGGDASSPAEVAAPQSPEDLVGDPEVAVITKNQALLVADDLESDGTRLWTHSGSGGKIFQLEPPIEAPVVEYGEGDEITFAMVFGYGELWQTGLANTESPGTLVRANPDTGAASTIALPYAAGQIVPAANSLWLSGSSADSFTGVLMRVDPATNAVSVVSTEVEPATTAVGDGDTVWISGRNELKRLDAAKGSFVASVPLLPSTTGYELATGAGSVWVGMTDRTGAGAVIRIDPATNKVTGNVDLPGGPTAIVAAAGSLWVIVGQGGAVTNGDTTTTTTEPEGIRTKTLYRIDPAALKVTGSIMVPDGNTSMEVIDDTIWLLSGQTGDSSARLLHIEPA